MKKTVLRLLLGLALAGLAFTPMKPVSAAELSAEPSQISISYKIRLFYLTCYQTEDDFGNDEAYIRINGTQVWPSSGYVSINEVSTIWLGKSFNFSPTATIKLY